MTKDLLDRFIESEPDSPFGLRNRAMLLLGYELLSRRSELVALRTADITRRPDGTRLVIVRRSKADPFGQGRLAFTSQETASRVQDWIDWRGPYIEVLFCPIYQGKAINRELSTTVVKSLIKDAATRDGFGPTTVSEFSAHSMRVGAAQDSLK